TTKRPTHTLSEYTPDDTRRLATDARHTNARAPWRICFSSAHASPPKTILPFSIKYWNSSRFSSTSRANSSSNSRSNSTILDTIQEIFVFMTPSTSRGDAQVLNFEMTCPQLLDHSHCEKKLK